MTAGTDRRALLAAALAAPIAARVRAVPAETLPLWPGAAPGGEGVAIVDQWVQRAPGGDPADIAWPHVATPRLIVHRPARPNGAAILVIPGGAYRRIALRRGGSAEARLLAARGYVAADLLYRLPHDGWAAGPDAPLQDAQRAMRVIRARAAGWGVDPARVAAVGFSAGGHLAARLGSRAALATYPAADAADRLPCRPVTLGLFFPVVRLDGPFVHAMSRDELLGAAVAARTRAYSADAALPPDMPPTFVACAADDPVVPYQNSLAMFTALQAAHVAAELAIYERGGHGLPPDDIGGSRIWPGAFLAFAERHGL